MAYKIILNVMGWVWRLIWLNFIWLIFSVPIVTVVPATFAMFDVANKWFTVDNDIEIIPHFAKSFKKHFFKSFTLGLPLLLVGAFLVIDLLILNKQASGPFIMIQYAIMFLSLVYLFILFYSIPTFVQFNLSFSKLMMMAFTVAIKQPLISFLMLCGILTVVVVFLVWTGIGILFIGSISATLATKAALTGYRKLNMMT